MNITNFTIKIILIIITICKIKTQQEKDLIQKVINAKLAQLPSMQEFVNAFFPPVEDRNNFIHGTGFIKFAQKTDVAKYMEVPHDSLKDFLDMLVGNLEVPKDKKSAYVGTLLKTKFATKQNLIINDLIFNTGNGKCKYVTVIGVSNKDNKTTDWFVADIKLKFDLAPDIAILRQTKSFLFGIFSETKINYVSIPKSLNEQQIIAVSTYFEIVTFQHFKSLLKTSNLKFLE